MSKDYLDVMKKISLSIRNGSSVVLSPKEIETIINRSDKLETWMLTHISNDDLTIPYLTTMFDYSEHEAENIIYDIKGE